MKNIELENGFYDLSTLTYEELLNVTFQGKPLVKYEVGSPGGAVVYQSRLSDSLTAGGMEKSLADKIASRHPKVCIYAIDGAGWGEYIHHPEKLPKSRTADPTQEYRQAGRSPWRPLHDDAGKVIGKTATCPAALPKGMPTKVLFFENPPILEAEIRTARTLTVTGNILRWGEVKIDISPRRLPVRTEAPEVEIGKTGWPMGFKSSNLAARTIPCACGDARISHLASTDEIIGAALSKAEVTMLSAIGIEFWVSDDDGEIIPWKGYGLGSIEKVKDLIETARENPDVAREIIKANEAAARGQKGGRWKIRSLFGK